MKDTLIQYQHYMKKLYLLFVLFSTHQLVFSQNNTVVKGTVIEENTGQPLPNVAIQVWPGSKFGSISNKEGRFKINTDKDSITLKFSHISSVPKLLKINTKIVSDSNLLVTLSPFSYTLDAVEISEEKFETIYKKPNQSVIDYEIYDHRIYFLLKDYSNRKYQLISVDENLSDTIFSTPPGKPRGIIIDFYGNLDIVSKSNWVYQIIIENGQINYLEPFDYSKLKKVNELYDFKIDSNYYFSEFQTKIKDKINYGKINRGSKNIFYSLFDEDKINYFYDEMRSLDLIRNNMNAAPPGEKRRDIVTKLYDRQEINFTVNFMYNHISNAYFHINDSIYIIDNIKNKLLKFDKSGKLVSELNITHSNDDEKAFKLLEMEEGRIWKDKALIDNCNNGKAYFLWKQGARTELYSLDIKSGEISFIETLPHVFPIKIKVYNNTIYYLYQKIGNSRNYGLYRMYIN